MWKLDHKEGLALKNWYFWITVLEKTLESPLDCKEIKSINLKGNRPYSLEGLMLKLQYFGHLVQRADSLEKTWMLGKTEGRRKRGQQRMRWLDGITDSRDMSLSKLWEDSEGQGRLVCSPWGRKESDTTEQLNNNKLQMVHFRVLYQFPLILSMGEWLRNLYSITQHLLFSQV